MLILLQHYPLVCHAWSPLKPLSMKPLSIRQKGSNLFKRVLPRKIALPFELSSSSKAEEDLEMMKSENSILRETIRQLEDENQALKQRNKIVLENFEGESLFRDRDWDGTPKFSSFGITLSGEEISQDEQWCDELDGGRYLLLLLWCRLFEILGVPSRFRWLSVESISGHCSHFCLVVIHFQTNAPSNQTFPSRKPFVIVRTGW